MADETPQKSASRFFNLGRIITLIKYCALVAVAAYMVHFVAQIIYYRNAEHKVLNASGEVAYAASGIAFAFLIYGIAHLVDQYRADK